VGFSSHALKNYPCFAAVALGARIVERHYTADKAWPGPDIEISVDPAELRDLIDGCDAVFRSLGGSKEILREEQPTIDFAYASVVSIRDIRQGEAFTHENIWVKRPGTGQIPAEEFSAMIGRVAARKITKDAQLSRDDIANG
jgi:N-acetylneuraminate synthase